MTKIKPFEGFRPSTIQFLRDLAENNYKEWFEEHRDVYESELLIPFKELATSLTPCMYNIDPQFELRTHRVLSRIYRDVRFSKNKDPYKTCMWMSFQQPTKGWEDFPGFFMELNADRYFYGMGLFMPKKKTMDNFRESVAYDAKDFQQNTQLILDRGFQIGGDLYKRLVPNDLDEYFQPWIQRKGIYVYKESPIRDEVFTRQFMDMIREDYESLKWLYDFMKEE